MRLLAWLLAASGVLWILLFGEPWHACGRHAAFTTIVFTRGWCRGGERNASASLKTIASAQADYRGNDRDGNGIQDYWRGDVAGLYGVLPAGSAEMTKLIEISVAGSDPASQGKGTIGDLGPGQIAQGQYTVFAPKAGYLYRALRHADEDPDALDARARFAACAYPAVYSKATRVTFIIDEGNTIYGRDLGRPGYPDVFPDPDTLKRDWSKLD